MGSLHHSFWRLTWLWRKVFGNGTLFLSMHLSVHSVILERMIFFFFDKFKLKHVEIMNLYALQKWKIILENYLYLVIWKRFIFITICATLCIMENRIRISIGIIRLLVRWIFLHLNHSKRIIKVNFLQFHNFIFTIIFLSFYSFFPERAAFKN